MNFMQSASKEKKKKCKNQSTTDPQCKKRQLVIRPHGEMMNDPHSLDVYTLDNVSENYYESDNDSLTKTVVKKKGIPTLVVM